MLSTICLSIGCLAGLVAIVIGIRLFRVNHELRRALRRSEGDHLDILRNQQGLTFKFTKVDGRFVHTFSEGQLGGRLGTTPQDVLGKTFAEFAPDPDPEYAAYKESFYERAWQGEELSYEGRMNGLWYIASLRPIYENGKVIEVIASCVDITQQKLAEHDLRASEQMYRLIAESSTDLIRILDIDMTIRYASPSHAEVLGFDPRELEGLSCSELVVPEERDTVARQFYDMVNNKRRHYQLNFHAPRKDGSSIMVETHGRLVLDDNGNPAGVVVVSRDLTKRMQEHEENRRRDKLTLAGQLAAGIAHEIRNPLTAIKGFTQLLRTPSDRQTFYTDVISTELSRVESIVNEFLLLAKPEAAQFQEHNLCDILTDVVTLLGPQALMQKVQININASAGRPSVFAVASQLKQVFINVLKNAIEAMPNGGSVELSMVVNDSAVVVSVQDQGIGIDEAWIHRLGEPFYTTKEKGTGLGLMVSYKIVRDHGGHIAVESAVGSGTSIHITLPMAQHSARAENADWVS